MTNGRQYKQYCASTIGIYILLLLSILLFFSFSFRFHTRGDATTWQSRTYTRFASTSRLPTTKSRESNHIGKKHTKRIISNVWFLDKYDRYNQVTRGHWTALDMVMQLIKKNDIFIVHFYLLHAPEWRFTRFSAMPFIRFTIVMYRNVLCCVCSVQLKLYYSHSATTSLFEIDLFAISRLCVKMSPRLTISSRWFLRLFRVAGRMHNKINIITMRWNRSMRFHSGALPISSNDGIMK